MIPNSDDSESFGSLYTGLNSAELEHLPETVMIHHATRCDSGPSVAVRADWLSPRLIALCSRPLNVVLPLPFTPEDPHACAGCLEVLGLPTEAAPPHPDAPAAGPW